MSSPASASNSPRPASSASTKSAYRHYSVRSRALKQRRKAEREEAADGTTESEEDDHPQEVTDIKGRKRARIASLSPSPTPKSQRRPSASLIDENLKSEGEPDPKGRSHGKGVTTEPGAREATISRTSPLSTAEGLEEGDCITAQSSLAPAGRPLPSTPPPPPRRHTTASPFKPSPRDLSDFFSPSHDVSPGQAGSAAKLRRAGSSRRMLTKAQSLGDNLGSPSRTPNAHSSPADRFPSSLPSTPSRTPTRTQSMPVTPTRSAFAPTQGASSLLQPLVQPDKRPISGGRAKRIYGGNRTILAQNDDVSADDETDAGDGEERKTYAELRQRYDVDNDGWDGGNEAETSLVDIAQARAPLPVADMRSKGENRRFLDELGYLVDGISDPQAGTAIKRTSCVELLQNMQDDAWTGKIHSCGQIERIWEALMKAKEGDDVVIVSAIILFLVICARNGVSLEPILLSQGQQIIEAMLSGLRLDGPISSTFKMSTSSASTVKSFWSVIANRAKERLSSGDESQASSLTDIRLAILRLVGNVTHSELLHDGRVVKLVFDYILSLLGDEVRHASSSNPSPQLDVRFANASLSLLTTLIFSHSADAADYASISPGRSTTLVDVIELAHRAAREDNHRDRVIAASCVLDSLQILTFFTKANSRASHSTLKATKGASELLGLVAERDRLVDILSERNFQHEPADGNDIESGAQVTGDDILSLVLAILVSGLSSASTLRIGDTVWPAKTDKIPSKDGASVRMTQKLFELFRQYQSETTKTSAIISGYLAVVLVTIGHEGEGEWKGISDPSRGQKVNGRTLLENALRALREIQKEDAAIEDDDDVRAIQLAIDRIKGVPEDEL